MMPLPVWSHVPSGRVVSVQWGSLSRMGSVQRGGLPAGVCLPPPVNRQTGVKTLPSLAVGNNKFTVVL